VEHINAGRHQVARGAKLKLDKLDRATPRKAKNADSAWSPRAAPISVHSRWPSPRSRAANLGPTLSSDLITDCGLNMSSDLGNGGIASKTGAAPDREAGGNSLRQKPKTVAIITDNTAASVSRPRRCA
jgi:hypothetical protein